jgi:thioredoxin reductase (NADPH)
VYGASEGLRTLLVEAEAPGGQAGASSRIDNYLGFPGGLSGAELTRRAVTQAQRFGVEILNPQRAVGVRAVGNYRLVKLASGSEVACHALLIATGVSYRKLEVENIDRLTGAGVYYGAVITEAISCKDREVFILGGGNSAGQAAVYLSRFARSITILTIGQSLAETMSQYLIDQVEATENIHVRTGVTVSAVQGEDHLESVTIRDEAGGGEEAAPAVALFIYIGAQPRTDWLENQVACDDQGYILTGEAVIEAGATDRFRALGREPHFLESSVPGIFAAGDIRSGSVKRIASSVGEGAMAVTLIHQYLAAL